MAQQLTVGCKLPNGLLINHAGKRVVLNGTNSTNLIGGHGLTVVDKEFFDAWYEKNRDYAPVKQGLIFAHEKKGNAEAEAIEKVKNKSGFEGINADKPGHGVEKADVKQWQS